MLPNSAAYTSEMGEEACATLGKTGEGVLHRGSLCRAVICDSVSDLQWRGWSQWLFSERSVFLETETEMWEPRRKPSGFAPEPFRAFRIPFAATRRPGPGGARGHADRPRRAPGRLAVRTGCRAPPEVRVTPRPAVRRSD